MTLALFDLDHTLLNGDSDHEWGNFLIGKKLVDESTYKAANEAFFSQYQEGTLDIFAYSAFSFVPLSEHSMAELQVLHDEYMESVVLPMIANKARALVDRHREQGDTLVVITATNSFITRPIVAEFGIEHLIATEPLIVAGRFTNKIQGIPCFQDGKVLRLEQWLKKTNNSLECSVFYSDSINDLPLMERVTRPIAVDPDPKLRAKSLEKGWEIISLLG